VVGTVGLVVVAVVVVGAVFVMVTAMFIFGAAMVRAGAAELIGMRLFKACAHNELLLQLAVLGLTTLVSMFINDTTVTIIFLPMIMSVCKERGLSPSRYLLWVAFGSLLGGQWTLIGTRSNIVISDFLRMETGRSFGFFDLTPIAAVVFLACAVFLTLLGRKWLPSGKEPQQSEEPLAREYLTEVMVTPGSNIVGKALNQIEWARRNDLTVVEVIRGSERLPRTGWLKLQSEDVLVMQGPVPTISQLLRSPDFTFKEELRLDNYERAKKNAQFVSIELDRIEGKIQALAEMAVNRQDPDLLSSQVDSAAESMRQTEKAVSELQHLTGLADELQDPPAILDADLRQVLRNDA